MSIYDSKIWIEDCNNIIKANPWICSFEEKSILITGIGGLICSAIADILIRYNETHEKKIKIIAAARSKERIKNRFCEYFDRSYFKYFEYDAISSELNINYPVDYIIHGASNSSPDMIAKEPVETMLSNFNGLYTLLKYAKKQESKRLLYISSSEVYGIKNDNKPFSEKQYGYIDILNTRNSYSLAKRASETLCISFSEEFGLETVIVRPGHIYGPTATNNDKHVSSLWAYDAAAGKDIIMKSDGSQIRSYCYCLDAASAILTVLLKGKNKKAYNISSPNSVISIRKMAEIISQNAGVKLKIQTANQDEKKQFNPMLNSSLDSKELLELKWINLFDAEKGFKNTVEIIKQKNK